MDLNLTRGLSFPMKIEIGESLLFFIYCKQVIIQGFIKLTKKRQVTMRWRVAFLPNLNL